MIVNRIAEVAKTKGKTVGQVSQETGIRYNTVLNLFRGQGRRIDLDTIDAVCRVLKAQPGELFQWQPDTVPAAGKESQPEKE
jgi:putative transcriptional regulator